MVTAPLAIQLLQVKKANQQNLLQSPSEHAVRKA